MAKAITVYLETVVRCPECGMAMVRESYDKPVVRCSNRGCDLYDKPYKQPSCVLEEA